MVGFFSFLLSKNGGKIYTQKFIILAISECTVEWHEVRSHCGTAVPMVQALCMWFLMINAIFPRSAARSLINPGSQVLECATEARFLWVYLGRHVHEVVQDKRRGFQEAPAIPFQPVGGIHFPFPVLDVVFRAVGAWPREEEPAVHQLDVVQPEQQIGEHSLLPVWVGRGESLAYLWAERQWWRAMC